MTGRRASALVLGVLFASSGCLCGEAGADDAGPADAGEVDGGSDALDGGEDAGFDGGGNGDGGSDGGVVDPTCVTPLGDAGYQGPLLVRLFTGGGYGAETGVHIWNHIEQLSVSRVADAVLPTNGTGNYGPPSVALSGRRLFAASYSALHIWNDATSVATGATPIRIPLFNYSGGGGLGNIWSSPSPTGGRDLWGVTGDNAGSVIRFADTDCLRITSRRAALFSHPRGLSAAAYSLRGDRLFAAQNLDAGIMVWTDAGTTTGTAGPATFRLAESRATQLIVDGDRLFAHANTPELLIWNNASGLAAPAPPDVVLDGDSGLGNIASLQVAQGVLIVTMPGQVNLYASPQAISANLAPTQTIAHPVLSGRVGKALLGSDGTLYVLHANNVAIFSNALTNPTLKVDLALASPADLVLVE